MPIYTIRRSGTGRQCVAGVDFFDGMGTTNSIETAEFLSRVCEFEVWLDGKLVTIKSETQKVSGAVVLKAEEVAPEQKQETVGPEVSGPVVISPQVAEPIAVSEPKKPRGRKPKPRG